MKIEIVDQPIRFQLHGFSSVVEDNRFGEVGFRLMNEMWQVVKSAHVLTTGINHWVYLPDGKCSLALNSKELFQVLNR